MEYVRRRRRTGVFHLPALTRQSNQNTLHKFVVAVNPKLSPFDEWLVGSDKSRKGSIWPSFTQKKISERCIVSCCSLYDPHQRKLTTREYCNSSWDAIHFMLTPIPPPLSSSFSFLPSSPPPPEKTRQDHQLRLNPAYLNVVSCAA